MRQLVILAVVSAVFALTGSARAAMIQLVVDPMFGSTEATGATASLWFDFGEDGLDDLLSITILNTTPPEIGSMITAVGFELPDPPSLSAAFATGGAGSYFDTLTFNDSVSPGRLNAPGGYDVMLTSDGNFEGGSPQGAPRAGTSDLVVLSLGDTGMTPDQLAQTFFDFYETTPDHHVIARFQSVGPNGEGSDKVGGHTPEPASLMLLALGGLALLRRR